MAAATNPAFAEAFEQNLTAELEFTQELERRTDALPNAAQGGVSARGLQTRPGIVALVEGHRDEMKNLSVGK